MAKLTTMKQESIRQGLTDPTKSKRPKSWSGGAVAKTQAKGSREKEPFGSEKIQNELALAKPAAKLNRALGNKGNTIDRMLRLKEAVRQRGGK